MIYFITWVLVSGGELVTVEVISFFFLLNIISRQDLKNKDMFMFG